MATLPRQQDTDYDPGDFLLIDKDGVIQAVSGNSDFWDDDDGTPMHPMLSFTIVKVMVTQVVDDNGTHYAEYDYASEECPDCITRVNQPIPYEPGPNWGGGNR
jgi:hypothetical protein